MNAIKRLMNEFKELVEGAPECLVAGPKAEDNVFEWDCVIQGPEESFYDGGAFKAELSFPKDYPLSPPTLVFVPPLYHPNIYKDGKVCISILHQGEDQFGYEKSNERWSPVQSVEKILMSVISMLAEPNTESPANVDASNMYRNDIDQYRKIVDKQVKDSIGL